jgi:hypothetical protein
MERRTGDKAMEKLKKKHMTVKKREKNYSLLM